MGCSYELTNNYWISYKHILTDIDLKKILNKEFVYLISTESIPNFINIIEDSLIMKYKNKSDDKIFEIVKNNLIEKFENYELEKNIKIYNDYKE